MDPRKLIHLVAVIEEGSFKKASTKVGVSQPALSTSIARLEHSLGARLLERTSQGATPTPLGELIYAHARLIRDEVQRAKHRLSDQRQRDDGTIAMGTLPSLTPVIMPKAICQWRQRHPDPVLRITERIQVEALLSLIRGELDFIIAQTEWYGYIEGLRQRVLFRDRLHVIARPGHPAFALPQVTWSALAQYPWVIQMVGRHRTLLEKALASDGATMPRQLTECGSVPCLKALVAGSDSLAMLPASAIDAEVSEGRIRPLPIGGPLLNRDIAVIFREQFPLTPASRELVEAIAAVGLAVGEGPDPLSDAGKASPPHPCEQVPARLVPPMPPRRARAGSHNAAL
ncbi:LysR family transcriptional regulator [Falsiroseomonas stagni]|uniref:DNA-binding transcriptional regulator, LysR family n=1 Tax=Falsiroseomonas stagni DSM 19981 TaxID=1123062 RepID=A0A1I4CX91_9PROT|nr:LysR family transcriptional regulator [Falsiroseomonas stagni]SFK84827.1 DNA-binding transcriptional regulator, LysR family [Falsiroseomonas stagni DSM 19981]